MRKSNCEFKCLKPKKRYEYLRMLLERFALRASELETQISILCYGSCAYGYNPKLHGNFDDIDLFLIIPRSMPVQEILRSVRNVFETSLDVQREHLDGLLAGSWEIARMYGNVDGVKLGFRLMCRDTFESLCSGPGSVANIRNIAPLGASRIIVDFEWDIRLWRYVPIELEHALVKQGENDALIVNHHLFSAERDRLGAVGRKLLACRVVHDPSNCVVQTLKSIWRAYIQLCLGMRPTITTRNIIDSVMRSERFSKSFRRNLSRVIRKARS